jgi:hypothetical protein
MRNLLFSAIVLLGILISCNKQDAIAPVSAIVTSSISFKQDTVPITLSVTTARKEKVGSFNVIAIEGKSPDTLVRKNNLIIRITDDSARAYTNTEILLSYTDSLGMTYANAITDTINKVSITKIEKKKGGLVEGSFTIRASNSTKTKVFLLTSGKISTSFADY